MMNSQSAAAVNSANVSNVVNSNNYFSIFKRIYGFYKSVPTTDCQNLWDNIYEILKIWGNEAVITVNRDEFYMNVSLRRNEIGTYSLMTRCKNSNEEPKFAEVVTDVKVWRGKNINIIAHAILESIIDAYNEAVAKYYEPEDSTINETPVVEEAPMLDEAPMLEEDNITEEGYSVAGLAYAKEHTSGVSMADIIRKVAEEHWNFESVVKESQWTRFTNDSFRDLIWSTCWNEYLMDYTDEAMEAETRHVMDFDSVYDDLFGDLWPYMSTYDDSCGGCELWVNAWDVVERAAEIIEERGDRLIDWDEFPGYVMDAFLGNLYGFDTFTERVMSELEGGDIIGIMPYDDGLHLSFVDEEAEVAA